MGKGDQRSKRGKIHRGTFGKRRPKLKSHKRVVPADGASESQAASTAQTKEPKVVKKQAKE